MKRAEAKIIGSPFFQFYKAADNVNDIKTAKNLLYGALGDHCSLYPDCEYKFIPAMEKAKNHPDSSMSIACFKESNINNWISSYLRLKSFSGDDFFYLLITSG